MSVTSIERPRSSALTLLAEAAWDELTAAGSAAARIVPPTVSRPIRWAADALQRPFHAVRQATGGGTSLLYAGNDAHFFADIAGALALSETTALAPVFGVGRGPRGASHWPDAQVVAVETTHRRGDAFARAGFFLLPRWIDLAVDLAKPDHELWDAKKRTTVHRILRSDLSYEVVPGPSAIEFFYERMYAPTAARRHDGMAFVRRLRFVRRIAERGVLLFVTRGGERLSGMLLVPRLLDDGTVDAWLSGVLDGDYDRVGVLAREAIYFRSIRWARESHGAKVLGLTAAPPLLSHGLLRFKKRWGAHAELNPTDGRVVALKVTSATPELALRLRSIPLVHLVRRGGATRLGATLIAPPGADTPTIRDRFALPGIDDFEVPSTPPHGVAEALAARARASLG